jgi:hypothetical protein
MLRHFDIQRHIRTRDKVLIAAIPCAEGDSVQIDRGHALARPHPVSARLLQEDLDVTQTRGSAADRVVLGVDARKKKGRPA